MPRRKITPKYIAAHIRQVLKDGGSAPHAADVQRFFKEVVKSRGWRTAELRRVAVRFRRQILRELGSDFLLAVADCLFSGRVLEEKHFGVFLLENGTREFGDREFHRFGKWLDRVTNWADHDALVYYLIAPMVARQPARVKIALRWARSSNRWRRRAACVALIRGSRQKLFFPQITRLSRCLLNDPDDMVQKGLGWLLRETAKADPQKTLPYLMRIRGKAPRLVLRTACETLPASARKKVLR